MTFVLVSVVYAVAIGDPSFTVMGPFAIGLALLTMVCAGKTHKDPSASLNVLLLGNNLTNMLCTEVGCIVSVHDHACQLQNHAWCLYV